MNKDTKRVIAMKRGREVASMAENKRVKSLKTEDFCGFSKEDEPREIHGLSIINRIISQNAENSSITDQKGTSSLGYFQDLPYKSTNNTHNDTTRKSDVACQTSPDLHKALLLEMFPELSSYINDVKPSPMTTTVCTPNTKMIKLAKVNTPKKNSDRNDSRQSDITRTHIIPVANENKPKESKALFLTEVQPVSKRSVEEIIFSKNNTAITNENKIDSSIVMLSTNNNNNYTPLINNKDISFNEIISPITIGSGNQVNLKYHGVRTMKSTPIIDENHGKGFCTPITNLHSNMKPVSGTTQSELKNLNKIFENDVLKPGCMSSPDLTNFTDHTQELLYEGGSVVSKLNDISSPVKSEKDESVGSQELFKDDSSVEDEEVDPEVTLKQMIKKEIDKNEYHAAGTEIKIKENSKLENEESKVDLFWGKDENINIELERAVTSMEKNNSIVVKKKIRFSTSRWNNVKLIRTFENLFNAEYNNKLTVGMTHLIVKTEEGNTTDPTYKYLYAMVHGICIVSDKWLTDSLQKNSIVPESKYIPLDSSGVPGPLTSYELSLQGNTTAPSWLNNFCIMFSKPYMYGYSLSEIQELAIRIGATVINNEEEFDGYEKFHKVVVFADQVPQETAQEKGIGLLKKYNAIPVYFFWLVSMIGMYKVCSFYDHVVMIDLSYERLLQLKFPPPFISRYNTH